MGFHEDEGDGYRYNFSTDAMLVMIGLCKLMTKHGIIPSLSKSQPLESRKMVLTT